jgi:hypothetical protein
MNLTAKIYVINENTDLSRMRRRRRRRRRRRNNEPLLKIVIAIDPKLNQLASGPENSNLFSKRPHLS